MRTKYSMFLSDAIEKRVEQYGFSNYMSPDKYQTIQAVRKIIAVRLNRNSNYNRLQYMLPEELPVAMNMLEEILPEKVKAPDETTSV